VRTRTSTLPLAALTLVLATTLAFGFTDASALSVTTPSVTVDVNETGVTVDAGAVSVRSPATPAPVARPPADPVPVDPPVVDPPVVDPPVVDEVPTIRPTRPPASFATQPAEVPSEVAQAATEQNAYAGRP
jgi:hypothetical protein